MITEDYCSKEIYRLLREKGFDGEIHTIFDEEGYTQPSITLQMAMKWLREEANILITINVGYYGVGEVRKYDWNVCCMHKHEISYPLLKEPMPTQTYEEAVEAALKYCLENLI